MKVLFIAPFLILAACTKPQNINRTQASVFSLPQPELGEVWDGEAEEQAQEILDATMQMLMKDSTKDEFVRRDAHPKAHGCVKAQLDLDITNLSWENRVGLFGKNKKYDAWIRFSNGATGGASKHDLEKDVRGMAIKIMNVDQTPTGVHDILLANNKEFFSKDGSDYMDLVKTVSRGSSLGIARFAIMHPLSAKRILEARVNIGNVLKQDYHSSVPFKLGRYSARYRAVPCKADKDSVPSSNTDPNYLRQRLVTSLESQAFCFDFYVQPNLNPKIQNIEDPRIIWDDATSRPVKVGRITIPKQNEINSRQRINLCENMNFNPWHSPEANRPMGQINRIRSLVYEEISKYRHGKNRTPIMEPVNHEPCSNKTSSLCDDPR
jgi:catalase